MITAEQQAALARLAQYNTGEYSPTGNQYGLTGEGGTDANFDQLWRDVVTVAGYLASIGNDINFVTERAAVATILQRCQELVGQITPGSTSALVFPAVDKVLLSSGAVVQVYVYDTRLDDLASDGHRWNAPGRCARLSYWNEALGTYSGGKRDVPAVVAISALKEQWYFHDALDLDPVTGVPRLWRASNPTGNGLVLCGPAAPITCAFARNGYIYIGSGMGLHVVSLTGDWCERYDNGGRRRRLGTFAQRNTVLQEGGVIASGALPATAIIGVHAHVYPGAPLDPAGMPIPTVLALTAAGASIIHPGGQVVNLTDAFGFTFGCFLRDGRIALTRGDQLVLVGPLPYVSASAAAWAQVIHSTSAAPAVLNNGAGNAIRIVDGAEGGAAGLTFRAHDPANPANGMVAYVTTAYATGWLAGDVRGAWLCDNATGAITGAELVPNGSFATGIAGWSGNVSWVAGRLRVTGVGPNDTAVAVLSGLTVGQSYALVIGYAASADGGTPITAVDGTSLSLRFTSSGSQHDFVATATSTLLRLGVAELGKAVDFDDVSVRPTAADRSYKAKGLAIVGTPQRSPVAPGADVVAWSGFGGGTYLEQPYNADQDYGIGDFCFCGWVAAFTTGYILRRGHATTGPWFRLVYNGSGKYQFDINDGVGASASVQSVSPATSAVYAFVCIVRRVATGNIELWVNGVLEAQATASGVGSLSNALATLRFGAHQDGSGALHSGTALTMWRSGAYAPTPAQIRRQYADEAPLFQSGAKVLVGGSSSAVSSLDRDPLTGRLAVGTGDGVAVFSGLRRVSYLDEGGLAATTSDTVRSVALRGGSLLIGTAAEVGFVGDAVGGKEAIAVGGPRTVGNSFSARGVTTDATPLDLAPRITVGDRELVVVEARILGKVAGAVDTERLSYVRKATYYRDAGGAITLQGAVQVIGTDTEVTATADATFVPSGDWVAIRVTGVAAKRINWIAAVTVTRHPEENSYAA